MKGEINLPMVGMVVTTSPNFNLYNIVVFPAASRPFERHLENVIIAELHQVHIGLYVGKFMSVFIVISHDYIIIHCYCYDYILHVYY